MRFKIKLKLDPINLRDVATETSNKLNKILGVNNKWHDMERKPYTCSFLLGGSLEGKILSFKNGGYFYVNTEDDDVINAITSNDGIEFNIENLKVFKGYNLLSVKRIRYNTEGKLEWITEENKNNFIEYVKNKYCVDIDILKISNTVIGYKNNSNISVSDLLIRCKTEKNVANLFESGIGGSCSIGFGFVEPLKKD